MFQEALGAKIFLALHKNQKLKGLNSIVFSTLLFIAQILTVKSSQEIINADSLVLLSCLLSSFRDIWHFFSHLFGWRQQSKATGFIYILELGHTDHVYCGKLKHDCLLYIRHLIVIPHAWPVYVITKRLFTRGTVSGSQQWKTQRKQVPHPLLLACIKPFWTDTAL